MSELFPFLLQGKVIVSGAIGVRNVKFADTFGYLIVNV